MKRKYFIRALALSVSLILTASFLICMTFILQPKYISTSPEGSLTEEYYDSVKETKHDVLFIGDCEVYESFVPAVLWEEYGISSYVRGGAQQLVWHSYYMLEDALRYETPKTVVFNVLALKYGEPQREAYNRLALDGMEWSKTKLDAIYASKTEEESLASYIWPLLRYHGRWKELTAEDFRYAFLEKPAVSHSGYLMQTGIVPYEYQEGIKPRPLIDYTLPETAMAYLDRITDLCRERGIELILIKAPTNAVQYHWYDEWDEQIKSYAEENRLSYYNFIPLTDEMSIDFSTDTYDAGVHLNVYGAEKLTRYFGKILSENHGAPDRRDDTAISAVWDARLAAYKAQKAALTQP